MIEIESVTKAYDDKLAVDNVSIRIQKGCIFGLIGPNGAGKTTTLKMLATLIKPDKGSIRIGDLDLISDVREARRLIGYMPDAFGTFRGLSCIEYLDFFGRSYGYYGKDLSHRVTDVLELTELDRVREELTASLSTGMKQRLSLAKTLLHDPELLILDEPASGLDPRARIEIRSLLKELGKMGKTIIISSHILADLEEICSDVAIIEQGQVAWQGSLADAALTAGKDRLDIVVEVPEELVEKAEKILRSLDVVLNVRVDGAKLTSELVAIGETTKDEIQEGETLQGETQQGDAQEAPSSQASDSSGVEKKPEVSQTNELLSRLIAENIEIVSFSQQKLSLETIFLERTKGIVS